MATEVARASVRASAHERFFCRSGRWNGTFCLNGSERTDGFFLPQRLNKRNMLHFPCGAVAALRLAVAMEHERTYLLARTSGKTTARPPTSLRLPFQACANVMDLDFKIFDSERLIAKVEKRPVLYN